MGQCVLWAGKYGNRWNTHVREWITATSCEIMLGDAKAMNEDI